MTKYIAVYLRLSDDDGCADESNSIACQRGIIKNHIMTLSEFSGTSAREFADDGYSGTSFNRPGVARLLAAVRRGEVCCVIVKDFSRFGRQYLEVGRFIEQIFPCLGVRFIAVNDNYDSDDYLGATADIDVPVRNLINAMYSKDISKKVKSAKRTQMERGVFSNAFAPYGYEKSKSDRHILLIDEPAAKIVRDIFGLAEEGYSAFEIADRLNARGIPPPALYKKQNGSKLAFNETAKAFWTNGMISRILRDERYTGTLICGQHETIAVGSGKKRRTPKETWVRKPGVLPTIIAPDMFYDLAAKRQRFAVPPKPNTDRILYKKVRCGFCGHVMRYAGGAPKPYYICDTARYTGRYGCGCDRIREADIIATADTVVKLRIMMLYDLEKRCKSHEGDALRPAVGIEDKTIRLKAFKRLLYEHYKNGTLDRTAYLKEREAAEAKVNESTAGRNNLQEEDAQRAQRPVEPPIPAFDGLVEAVYIYGADRMEIRLSFDEGQT